MPEGIEEGFLDIEVEKIEMGIGEQKMQVIEKGMASIISGIQRKRNEVAVGGREGAELTEDQQDPA